jgi:threonine-phosphate decarboxylase
MHHGHGDNGDTYIQGVIADFSTNTWHGGEPPGLKEHLFRSWKRINNYPEALAGNLTAKLSLHHGLPPEHILITAGAIEGIYLLAQLYRGKRSRIIIPSFSEYEDACRIHDHQLDFLPWDCLAGSSDAHVPIAPTGAETDVCWLGNPNNPNGSILSETDLEVLLETHPQTLFAVDEAFIEFTDTLRSSIRSTLRFPNLVVFRSLTKVFAIPGLRLGYIAAGRKIIEKLQALKIPWSVNAFALEAGHFIFDHHAANYLPLTQLLKDKHDYVQQLRESGDLKITDSHTHFFLCETSRGSAAELQQWLLEQHGLLIRDASNFRGLGPGHFRLATLSPDRNQLLVTALKQYPPWKDR